MYKILNNHTAPNLRTSFRLNNECDNTYDLRNRETDLSLPKPNTDSGKRCFKYNGAVVWNNLPYEVKVAESLSSFQLEPLIRQTLKIGLTCCLLYIVNSVLK